MSQFRAICWLVLIVAVAWAGTPAVMADVTVGETIAGVPPDSALWELNRDAAGTLYVSDYELPAIVVVNPSTGAFTRYTFSLSASYFITPSDAKPDVGGLIWWSDYYAAFGWVDPSSAQVRYWNLTSLALQPAGFAFDTAGRVWFTQRYKTSLLRFNPNNNELCRFDVGGGGNYIISYDGKLWVGDAQARRILRFDPVTNQLTRWQLSSPASPQGLAFDADGRLWWADAAPGAGKLGRLSLQTNQATLYALPAGTQPTGIIPGIEVIWYTDPNGSVGFLDPARASGSVSTLTPSTVTISPTCSTVSSATQSTVKSNGTFAFSAVNWTTLSGAPTGITAYVPPQTPTTAPYGITFSSDRIWTTDQDRLVLARTPYVPRAPTVGISLSAGSLTLSWPAVTQDEGGGGVTVNSYQVWRSDQPYFRPWDPGVTFAGTTTTPSFSAGPAPAAGQYAFFGVRSVATSGLLSRTSKHVGAFSYALTPGGAP